MAKTWRVPQKPVLKALFIHDGNGKTLAEVKRIARNEALQLWYDTNQSLLRVLQISYFDHLAGWVAVVQRMG